jgi:transposase InsO family protein
VHHSTEGKIGLPSWPPTAPSYLGAIKGTPRRMEEAPKHSLSTLRHPDSAPTHLIRCVSDLSSIRVVNSMCCHLSSSLHLCAWLCYVFESCVCCSLPYFCVSFEKDRPCAACQAGKQVESTHHSKNVMTTSRPLELLHMDLFGPVAYLSIGGSKYGIVIVDDFSRFTWVFFLQDKSETQGTLKSFLRRAQNEFELKVKKIRSNNGSEFKNLQVEGFLEEEGIKHKFSAPYTPQQNGVVERKNRTLIDMARTMLREYKTPERFWSKAVNTACHAINRLYLHRLLKKTSYELLTSNKPNVSYFRVFGSKCYILVKKGRHSKFAPKAVEWFY